MIRSAAPLVFVFSYLLIALGCQNESKPTVKKDYSDSDLVGNWSGDFEKSWKKSKDEFLADTIRGEEAYPKDPAEKEKIVRQELEPIISGIRYEFNKDGTFDATISGSKTQGEYSLESKGQNRFEMTLKVKADPMMKDSKDKIIETKMDVTFVDGATIEIVYNGVAMIFSQK